MIPVTTTNDPKEIVRTFAAAVQERNYDLITSMLADNGKYKIMDLDFSVIDATCKGEFLCWFLPAITFVDIETIEYDTCILCKMGNPVVIFNNGQFPKVKRDLSIQAMNGLMLEIEDGLICGISFCYYFATKENISQLDYNDAQIRKLTDTGMELEQAVDIVLKREGYTDIWTGRRGCKTDDKDIPYRHDRF